MTIEFTTRDYQWAHGRMPKGRGWWMFEFEGYNFEHQGTLTEAKKACREYIKKMAPADYVGTVYVNVEP